jgi:dCMP deaminase
MNKWDQRFLGLAAHVAQWSKDPSTQVGAVIVDEKNRVVSLGFNGFPRGVEDRDMPREQKLLRTIHAEVNALLFARQDVEGCTMYVTHPPCAQCAAKIVQAGIKEVVCLISDVSYCTRWESDMTEALDMYIEAGVECRKVKD